MLKETYGGNISSAQFTGPWMYIAEPQQYVTYDVGTITGHFVHFNYNQMQYKMGIQNVITDWPLRITFLPASGVTPYTKLTGITNLLLSTRVVSYINSNVRADYMIAQKVSRDMPELGLPE